MQSNQVDKSKYPGGIITGVMPGSIGKELGITPGDKLLSIDGQPLIDILDYRYLIADEELEVVISRGDQELHFELEKDYDEDLGLEFEDVLFDQIRRCKNNCDFCFIYQLPKKMAKAVCYQTTMGNVLALAANSMSINYGLNLFRKIFIIYK